MPLPLILGGLAAVAGVGASVHGVVKIKEANDIRKAAQERHSQNLKRLEQESDKTNREMNSLETLKLSILKGFDQFSEVFERIHNRPEFEELSHEKFQNSKNDRREEAKKAFASAGVLWDDSVWAQMLRAEEEINRICNYLKELAGAAHQYKGMLLKVQALYDSHLRKMQHLVIWDGRTDWNTYMPGEQMMIENTVLLVGLLYNMCKVQLVLKTDREDDVIRVNHAVIDKNVTDAKHIMDEIIEKESIIS